MSNEKLEDLVAEPLDAPFGAVVTGWQPDSVLDDHTVHHLRALLAEHHVLVFRGHRQTSDDELIAFGSRFGALFDGGEIFNVDSSTKTIIEITNEPDGNGHEKGVAGSAMLPWHTDYSYLAIPALESFLNAVTLPPSGGGDTSFCDLYDAFETLPTASRAMIEHLDAFHELRVSDQFLTQEEHDDVWSARGRRNPDLVYPGAAERARHPVVQHHPTTGRPALYVNSFLSGFVDRRTDVVLPEDDARTLLHELFAHAVQPERILRHEWQVCDIVIFDTVGTIHRRETFDHTELRLMRQMSTLMPA